MRRLKNPAGFCRKAGRLSHGLRRAAAATVLPLRFDFDDEVDFDGDVKGEGGGSEGGA